MLNIGIEGWKHGIRSTQTPKGKKKRLDKRPRKCGGDRKAEKLREKKDFIKKTEQRRTRRGGKEYRQVNLRLKRRKINKKKKKCVKRDQSGQKEKKIEDKR